MSKKPAKGSASARSKAAGSSPKPTKRATVTPRRRGAPRPGPGAGSLRGSALEEIQAGVEDDYFVSPEPGQDYGRCGGREIRSLMERWICDQLSGRGVPHSHAPRRFEVKVDGGRVAAYSPSIVLRGRGREGKIAILEAVATGHAAGDVAQVAKIRAFHDLYEAEFYIMLVAPTSVLDSVPESTYDEAILPSGVGALVARLAE